jgi:hypothetical protein
LSTLVLALLTAGTSAWLSKNSNVIECERLAPLGVVAILSAFVIALCFRQMSRASAGVRWQLLIALILAGASLYADVRFVALYRRPCQQVQKQLHMQS